MFETNELHVGNPFAYKSLLPKAERIKPLVIPTQKDYDAIALSYSQDAGKQALLDALSIIRNYGVRISAFHNFEVIPHNRIRITQYKGKEQSLLCESIDVEKFKNVASRYKDTKSLEVNLIKFLKKCHARGPTTNAYSPHDFRHLYACNLYKQDKDIIQVSVALNHSNIAVTDTYISNLKRNGGLDSLLRLQRNLSQAQA
jgi:integrase